MSLVDQEMESCTMIDKTTGKDEYGGFITTWTDGAPFQAAIVLDSSLPARVAAVQGVTSLYTITTRKEIVLHYHDVFRRESDGQIFRVTTNGKDKRTPKTAALNMREVNAEEYVLTAEVEEDGD